MSKLKKRYKIPGLNKKAFQNNSAAEVKSKPISTTQLAENLVKTCRESIPTLEKNIFNKHIIAKNRYNMLSNMIEGLQTINNYFRSNAFAALTEDERYALVSKLTESIDQCTAGLHIRVNAVLASLFKDRPSSLPGLLYHARKALVEQATGEMNITNEVHTNNRIYIIAEKDGLGVAADLKKDDFTGLLSHKEIRMGLEKKFKEAFTPSQLPFLLAETLRGFLVIEGYVGPKKEGESYTLGEKEAIIGYIKGFLQFPRAAQLENTTEDEESVEDYFIIEEETYLIRDIDWNKIHRYLLDALEKNDYFELKKVNPQSVIEHICYAELTSETYKLTDNQLTDIVKLLEDLLDKRDYYALQVQFKAIQARFPSYYTKLINTEKFKQFPRPLPQFFFLANLDNSKSAINPMEVLKALKPIVEGNDLSPDRIAYTAKLVLADVSVGSAQMGILSLASDNQPAMVKAVLQFIDEHSKAIDVEKLIKAFLEKDYANRNILMRVIIQKHSEVFSAIVSFATKHPEIISTEVLNKLLIEKDSVGGNVLMQAIASSESKAVATILESLGKHTGIISIETLSNLLIARDGSGRSILLQAIETDQPEALATILAFIAKYPNSISVTTLADWFTERDARGRNVLMRTIESSQVGASKALLTFAVTHPEIISVETLTSWLIERDDQGRNVLTQAIASNQAGVLGAILTFTFAHSEIVNVETLTSWLLERDARGRNVLAQAIESNQAGALEAILLFTAEHPNIISVTTLTSWLIERDDQDRSILTRVIKSSQPEAFAIILAFTNLYPKFISVETLSDWFVKKDDQGRNILMQAIASSQSGILKAILAFKDKHPEIISVTTLTSWLVETDNMDIDVLTHALLSKQPEKLQDLLTLVAQDQNIFEVFIEKHKKSLMDTFLIRNIFSLNDLYSQEACKANPKLINRLNYLVQVILQNYLQVLQAKVETENSSRFKRLPFYKMKSLSKEIKFIDELVSTLKDGKSLEDFSSDYPKLSDGKFSELIEFCTTLQKEAKKLPSALTAILTVTDKDSDTSSVTTITDWFAERDTRGRNLLTQAIESSQAGALEAMLTFAVEHPEISVATFTNWLTERDARGRNILMQAIESSQAGALEAILTFAAEHPDNISVTTVTDWFVERDDQGRNILMQAVASSQPEALATILAFADAYSEIISDKTLTDWFTEKDDQDRNILMQAIASNQPGALGSNQSGALETLLAFTVANPEIISDKILTDWFVEKNSMGMDVLTQALSSKQPEKVQALLALSAQNQNIFNTFIDKHKEKLMSNFLKENIFPLNDLYSQEACNANPKLINRLNYLVQIILQNYLQELQAKSKKESGSHFKGSRFFKPRDSIVSMEMKFIDDLLSSFKNGNSLEDFKSNYLELSDGKFSKLVDFCTLLQAEAENAPTINIRL